MMPGEARPHLPLLTARHYYSEIESGTESECTDDDGSGGTCTSGHNTPGPERVNVMPLVTDNIGQERQKPYAMTDVAAIVARLPPIDQGGGAWITKLMDLTTGTSLALGDIRSILAACGITASTIFDIETKAGTSALEHETPLSRCMAPSILPFEGHSPKIGLMLLLFPERR